MSIYPRWTGGVTIYPSWIGRVTQVIKQFATYVDGIIRYVLK